MPHPPLRLLAARLPAMALALALGLAGGLAARALGLPLPMMLGSLLALGSVAVAGLRPLGIAPWLPERMRFAFVPVIGVAIGAAFTPELLAAAAGWLPTILAVVVYVPLVHWIGYRVYRRLGRLDPATAFFSAMPGGLVEALTMGEAQGADRRMLTMLQFLRLILCMVTVPVGFTLLTGGLVGSAAGVGMAGAELPLAARDVALLTIAGVGGYLLGQRLGIPGGVIIGPMLLSAAIHLAGLTRTVPPGWMIDLTQLVVGTSLGLRFEGLPRATLRRALGLAAVSIALSLATAVLFALALHRVAGERTGTLLLALAPGGVVEMSLVALSLQVSVAFVTAHHLLRIFLSVAVGAVGARWLLRR